MNTISEATRKILILGGLPGVGPATLNVVLEQPGFATLDLSSFPRLPDPVLRALANEGALERAEDRAETVISSAMSDGARILSPLDEEYPELLALTADRPPVLYVKGDLGPTRGRALCVIGTREPTRHGKIIAQRITSYFAERRWSVVSGLALGTDGIAHQATIEAGGHTVAVLAHGLDTVAPKSHAPLAQKILSTGGALITEYAYGVRPYGPNFVKRDRIQAGLASGVVLIQTDIRGGSLHATRAALEYGRLVAYPVPTSVDMAHSEPKIQGVLKIHNDLPSEVARYLKCRPEVLSNLRALHSKDDYEVLERDLLSWSRIPEEELRLV